MMRDDVKKVLFTEQEITERCRQLGKQITEDYKDRGNDLLIVGILKGSLPFLAELIKYIDLYVDIDFMIVSSYEGTESSGSIKISHDLGTEAEGRDLLVVEDIVDTGLTLSNLTEYLLSEKKARSVEIVTLLNKPSRRLEEVNIKYCGFEIENEFVIGYGLDYNQKYRNLPYIGVLKEELYQH